MTMIIQSNVKYNQRAAIIGSLSPRKTLTEIILFGTTRDAIRYCTEVCDSRNSLIHREKLISEEENYEDYEDYRKSQRNRLRKEKKTVAKEVILTDWGQ